jgi:hypothetical protein
MARRNASSPSDIEGHDAIDVVDRPPPSTRFVRVLIVDDDADASGALQERLSLVLGFRVFTTAKIFAARAELRAHAVDAVLIDWARGAALGLIEQLKAVDPDIDVIATSERESVELAVTALRSGACDFIVRPSANVDVLERAIRRAVETRRETERAREPAPRIGQVGYFGDLVGSSAPMREVYRVVTGVASTASTVLVLGESGTGKELIARATHQYSSRADKPFIAVNCGAIPVELIESELFGHVRGAFTGATRTRMGLFEEANEGTIFLDEVGDLPLAAQVKLLRVLQEGEIKRVGSNETISVDVRVIAATNSDLKQQISRGEFRSDLYYRLHVIAVDVPPLRERAEDIPILAHHFVHRFAVRMGRTVARVGDDAMLLLSRYAWPGNVRELENVMEHAVVMAKFDEIVPADLPRLEGLAPPVSAPRESSAVPFEELVDLPYAEAKKRAIDAFDRAYVRAALERSAGNVSEAARRAGLDRSNFRRVAKKA